MTRYEWPPAAGRPRGRSRARRADIAGQAAGTDPAARPYALARRRADQAGALRAAAPRLAPGQPPGPFTNLWLPMGPGTTLRGLTDADPRVSGRVRDLAVSDDGARIYAGTAGGGVWYSGDSGISWLPVGTYTLGGDVTTDAPSSTTLAVGALHVRFGAGPDQDEVWAGTGEPDPTHTPNDLGVKATYGGIGILHATEPVHTVLQDPDTDPWEHGAPGLRGQGVYAFAENPAAASAVIAGTTAGLHSFDPAAGPLTEPWSLVTVAAWEALLAGSSGRVHVTDLAWVSTPAGPRLWVAVAGTATPATVRGLWRSDNGLTGPFHRVDLTGVATDAQRASLLNLGLAAAPSDPTVLYVLSTGPRLWRVDGDATVRRVRGLPVSLFGAPPNSNPGQGEYDLAVAVDPAQPLRVAVGGGAANSSLTPGTFAASLYRLNLRTPAPVGAADWHTDYAGNDTADTTWIGEGVHPDVHRLRWLAAVAPGGTRLHVACDGGVFVSTAGGDPTTFAARNTGLGPTEAGYLDSHPTSDGPVLIGVQDNATQLRIGDSVWRRANSGADGGGVAFDPSGSGRFIGQDSQGFWRDDADTVIKPSFRGPVSPATAIEDAATRFYSNLAAITNGRVTQLVLGTSRVWYSEQWFDTFADNVAGVWRVQGVTLPSFTDPRAGNANDAVTDVLDDGPAPPGTLDPWCTGVRALRWAGPDRLYVLMPGAAHRLDRNPNRTWQRHRILRRAVSAGGAPAPAASGPVIPPEGMLNDLAVHDRTAGPDGSFYVATSNPLEAAVVVRRERRLVSVRARHAAAGRARRAGARLQRHRRPPRARRGLRGHGRRGLARGAHHHRGRPGLGGLDGAGERAARGGGAGPVGGPLPAGPGRPGAAAAGRAAVPRGLGVPARHRPGGRHLPAGPPVRHPPVAARCAAPGAARPAPAAPWRRPRVAPGLGRRPRSRVQERGRAARAVARRHPARQLHLARQPGPEGPARAGQPGLPGPIVAAVDQEAGRQVRAMGPADRAARG